MGIQGWTIVLSSGFWNLLSKLRKVKASPRKEALYGSNYKSVTTKAVCSHVVETVIVKSKAISRDRNNMNRVTLREITKDTLNAVLALRVEDDQQHLVASNERSIAQAYFTEQAWFRAVYADEEPVGFLMMYLDEHRAEYFLWRLMTDRRYQKKGYGRMAMELAIAHVRSLPDVTELLTSYMPDVGNAGPFYEHLGFRETGDMDDGEVVMRLDLKS